MRDFEKLGFKIEAAETSEDDVGIMPANWESFLAFIACQTQWRLVAGLGGLIWLGLDYLACQPVLADINASPTVFADLRHLETAALPILNEAD